MKPAIRICTVVTGNTREEFLKQLDEAQKEAGIIELRVDYIRDLNFQDIEAIKAKTHTEAIFTCRKKEEGGMFEGQEHERIALLEQAACLGFEYIDIEYSTYTDHPIQKGSSKLILSYHNFTDTPPYWELTKLVFDMNQQKPEIIKIATMVQEDYDNQKLFRVLLSKKPTENQIIIGMGEKGKITRVLGPLLGNYLTYASGSSQTAPGQIDRQTLQIVYNKLSKI